MLDQNQTPKETNGLTRRMFRPFLALAAALVASASGAAEARSWISTQPSAAAFPLVSASGAAPLVFAAEDFKVVAIAARDLAEDIGRVTGRRPDVRDRVEGVMGAVVLIGTLGKNATIDRLVAEGRLDVSAVRGQWETFLIATVANPLPGAKAGLVIAGSDRRGTAFGAYELARAIGVSPWHWWADVPPAKRSQLHVAAGTRRLGPPSVKYRGVFLNDEDWGLQPWAAKTFEPEVGDIGPKTYAKLFELMLRLKANTVWPAMHACTKPFNFYADNKRVADDYAIVMGSSHAEPMLRNNVGEWKAPAPDYNYVANREGVLKYWEERVAENGKFENIYTLGMRGIHDSGIQGARTDEERVRILEQVFADQRDLLAKHVRAEVERVPQIFCAYKEVLDLYRQGLKVPDDVTIVWPDDNFGYIRNHASAAERTRSGGFGVYYHLSYLGAPLAYLWLSTTPPALVWEEMSKAYDHGARTLWIANVGDLKPAEIGTEFFLEMAWDIERWNRTNLPQFLVAWATREFGAEHAREIADVMGEFYRLNYQRKPEHLQWWLRGRRADRDQPTLPSPLTDAEIDERLAAFADLRHRATRLRGAVSGGHQDAFYQLVYYPVSGAALANARYFQGERAALTAGEEAARATAAARAADEELQRETRDFNETIAGGKWRHFMAVEPASAEWRSMRIAPWSIPKFAVPKPTSPERTGTAIAVEAESFVRKVARSGASWEKIPGLGRTGDSVAVFPTTMASLPVERLANDAPRLEYDLRFEAGGEFPLHVNLIPTQPIQAGRGLRFGVALNDEPPREVVVDVADGSREWAQNVLNATVVGSTKLNVPIAGRHTLRIYAVDAGVVLDKIVVDCGGLQPSYLGPKETQWRETTKK